MKKSSLIFSLLCFLQSLTAWGADDEKNYFVATQTATESSVSVAKQKAMLHARNLLATMINGKIKNVSDSYISNRSSTGESADEFVTETQMAVKMLLKGVKIADESVTGEPKGKYTVCVTLQLRKDDCLDTLCHTLSESESIKNSFQKDLFIQLWKNE